MGRPLLHDWLWFSKSAREGGSMELNNKWGHDRSYSCCKKWVVNRKLAYLIQTANVLSHACPHLLQPLLSVRFSGFFLQWLLVGVSWKRNKTCNSWSSKPSFQTFLQSVWGNGVVDSCNWSACFHFCLLLFIDLFLHHFLVILLTLLEQKNLKLICTGTVGSSYNSEQI